MFVPFGQCEAEPLRLFHERTFSAADLAKAVNHFIAIGEETAIRELTGLAPDHDFKRDIVGKGFDLPERVGWVCRILFEPKNGKHLRPPMYGALNIQPHSRKDWPGYPVAASGKSYFVLSQGYVLAGAAEEPTQYLEYCRTNGVFRKKPVPVPTRSEAQADVSSLRKSPAWIAVKQNGGGQEFEKWHWRFIQAQADSID